MSRSDLTDREFEVVMYLADGLTPLETSVKLGISINTLWVYVRSIKLKWGVETLPQIVTYFFINMLNHGVA